MSIKSKLLIYNILMILIPIILIILSMVSLATGVVYLISNEKSSTSFWDNMGLFTVYRIQSNISDIKDQFQMEVSEISSGGMTAGFLDKLYARLVNSESSLSRNTLKACENINDTGSIMGIYINGNLIYVTEGNSVNELESVFMDVAGSGSLFISPCIISNAYGTVISSVSYLSDGSCLRVAVGNSDFTSLLSDTGSEQAGSLYSYSDGILVLACVVAAAIIFVCGLLLLLLQWRSILKPIRILQVAAHEIRDGNLDYEISYSSDDEIGRVCADFDEMRRKLKQSEAHRAEYDENRKLLIAGISHDIRTPLTTIQGYASGLLDGIASTDEKREMYIKTIYNTAKDMESLVNDLSLFTKLESDIMPFTFEVIDIAEFISDFLEDKRAMLAMGEAQVNFRNRCRAGALVSMDPEQFGRVLYNIVENSIKYKRRDGTPCRIDIEVSDETGGGIVVKLADNGTGVSKEELPAIFDTFYRTDKARTNVAAGSGLGLSISKQIVVRHRGRIWAQESAAHGLAIFIMLPAASKNND